MSFLDDVFGENILSFPTLDRIAKERGDPIPVPGFPGAFFNVPVKKGPEYAIFVAYLDSCIDESLLELAFISFKTLRRAIIVVDEFGKSRNWGYVIFGCLDQAKLAVRAMYGFKLGNTKMKLKLCETPLNTEAEPGNMEQR